ncbi:MAG: histidine kinase dimerization/phosphoacceptor domain -containing protein [Pseudomonadota bacterium]
MPSRRGSARLRLTILLTVALLPLGVIAVMQARGMATQAREMSERALLAETIRAAAAQREVIRTAQGQARALLPALRQVIGDPAACSALMEQVVAGVGEVAFAGFLDVAGHLDCTSDGTRHDVSGTPAFEALSKLGGKARVETKRHDAGLRIVPIPEALLVLQPVPNLSRAQEITPGSGLEAGDGTSQEGDTGYAAKNDTPWLGVVLLALPRDALVSADLIPGEAAAALDLTTFNAAGEILWSSPSPPGAVVGSAEAAQTGRLPEGAELAEMVGLPAHAVTVPSGGGDRRAYAIVPVIEGELTTIGSWPPDSVFAPALGSALTLGVMLPLAMWALSLLVAFVALNTMILRPLGSLRGRMQGFTDGARTLPPFRLEGAPDELRELAQTFDAMTDRIVSDETRLEKAVHDQEVLLKEVHHRVKNNLQLIASILNMQIRQHRSEESQSVLRRVQDRVMSLATVHQHLYQAPSLSTLRVDTLLSEIVNRKLADAGRLMSELQVDMKMDRVNLYPDQAVPLALLTGEAVSNAISHLGRPSDGTPPWLRLRLAQRPGGQVALEVSNSGGERLRDDQLRYRAGLGTRLIEAFASQLGGTLALRSGDAEGAPWDLDLVFAPVGFSGSKDRNTDSGGSAAMEPEDARETAAGRDGGSEPGPPPVA